MPLAAFTVTVPVPDSDKEAGRRLGNSPGTAWAGLAFEPGRSRRKRQIYSARELEVLQTINRYNENETERQLVHTLAHAIVSS